LMKSAANLVAMFENDDEEEKGERRQRQNKWKTYVVFWSYNNKKALFICRFFFLFDQRVFIYGLFNWANHFIERFTFRPPWISDHMHPWIFNITSLAI
jgi:hypothetical protein